MSVDLEPLTTDPNGWLFADVETRSWEDVTVHGAYRNMAKGRITVFTYALGDGPVNDWVLEDWTPGRKLDWRDAPADLLAAFAEVQAGRKWVVAWNSNYEFNAFTCGMIGLENFRVEWMVDAMVQASRSHLPADLMGAAKAIGGVQKQTAGKALIRLFADESGTATPQSHPVEWAQFRSYARDDVAAMRDVFFATMPLTRREWREAWAVDAINHRGVPVDVEFVRQAVGLSEKLTETSNADIARLTKGKIRTVNQSAALLDWLRYTLRALPEVDRILTREIDLETDEEGEEHAVAKMSLGRSHVEELIAYLGRVDAETGLTDDEFDALQVLEVRLYGASATPKKYKKIEALVEPDGFLRGQYVFNGAAATGRMSGRGAQLQNLSRDRLGSLNDEAEAIEMVAARGVECFDDLRERWGPVGRTMSRLIRPAFVAPEGWTFVWSDLANIEARVLPWMTASEGGDELLEVFRQNDADPSMPDVYVACAARILGKDPREVTKDERQSHGKVPCIAEGQLVLTDKGEVPIESVTLDMRVWDGVSWVSHQGLVYKGVRDVWEYDGVVATADHIVWTEETGKTTLARAAACGERLLQSGTGGTPVRTCGRDLGRTSLCARGVENSVCGMLLHDVRSHDVDLLGVSDARKVEGVSELLAASADTKMVGSTASFCAGALHEPERRQLAQLRGAWYRVPLSERNGCWAVDCQESGLGQGAGDRPYRHERPLRAGQSALGYAEAAELEQARQHPRGVDLPRGGLAVRLQHRETEVAGGLDARADHRAGARGCSSEAQKVARYRGKARVYDLVNAGPRHRFTVSGKLVHNCLALGFAGGKGALFNMARIYSAAFTDDEAQGIVDDWRATNKWAVRFWSQVWEAVLWCMENPGEPRTAGRATYVFDSGYLGGTLFAVLPCGRPLLYPGLRWAEVERKDKATGKVSVERALTVRKARARTPLRIMELVNNLVQGAAASVLRDVLVRLHDHPILKPSIVTHDEVLCLVREDQADEGAALLAEAMKFVPPWAEGLPISADSVRHSWYSKSVG